MSAARCVCHRCETAHAAEAGAWWALYGIGMIVCPDCGNKRCPKATFHDNTCTNSNEPEQPGSRYGGLPGTRPRRTNNPWVIRP